jgi:hypothetical protein
MNDNYDSIDKALNIESDIVETKKVSAEIDTVKPKGPDIEKDYEYTRANLIFIDRKGSGSN